MFIMLMNDASVLSVLNDAEHGILKGVQDRSILVK